MVLVGYRDGSTMKTRSESEANLRALLGIHLKGSVTDTRSQAPTASQVLVPALNLIFCQVSPLFLRRLAQLHFHPQCPLLGLLRVELYE